MVTASSVFINGIGGVFAGLAVLYVMMKLLAMVCDRSMADRPPPAPPRTPTTR